MLDNLNINQKRIVIILGIIILIGFGFFVNNKFSFKDTTQLEENILIGNYNENNSSIVEENQETIVVHITGAVKIPGVVRLNEGSRMEDAIAKAGGLTEDADISDINLAYILEDGIKIKIPSYLEEENNNSDENIITEENGENIVEETITNQTSKTKEININKASNAELQTLPGIGATLASKIIEYRNENGKFLSIEDIKNVNGLGDTKYNGIKDLISIK